MKRSRIRARDVLFFVLMACWLLAVLKPVFSMASGRPDTNTTFSIDWGIPVKWFGTGNGVLPDCLDIPKDSIGLDFLNMERCIHSFGTGPEIYRYDCPCDPFHRPYTYPPFLTFLFGWVGAFSSAAGAAFWSTAVLLFILVCGFAWAYLAFSTRPGADPKAVPLGAAAGAACAMALSYPSLFSFERGNHDVWVLLFMTLAGFLWVRQKWAGVGLVLMSAGLLKVYPLPLAASVGAAVGALVGVREVRAQAFGIGVRMAAGMAAAAACLLAAFWPGYLYYFSNTLPMLAKLKLTAPQNVHSHSLPAAFGTPGLGVFAAVWAAAVLMLAVQMRAWMRDRGDVENGPRTLKMLVFLMGFSVYLPNTSYDYNLILWIPFFMLFLCGWEAGEIEIAGLALLAAGCWLPRWLQQAVWPAAPVSLYLILQVAGAVIWLAGFWIVRESPRSGKRA